MRHLAWLAAVPKDDKKSRRAQLELSTSQQHLLELPDIEYGANLLGLWQEAGQVSQGGMGITGLSWSEISSWLQETSTEITVWEKLVIKSMSDAYASEYSAASEKDREAPYCPSYTGQIDRSAVAQQVVSVMQSLISKQPKPKTK